jgi:hypothetical protein
LLFSCNKDDDDTNSGLIGNWNLVEIRVKTWSAENWNDWTPNYSTIEYYNFINDNTVKTIFYDQTEDAGSYTLEVATNVLTFNFPNINGPFPIFKRKIILNENNTLILEDSFNFNEHYQYKFVKATN